MALSDMDRFAGHLPALAGVAIVAEACSALGTVVVREITGMTGIGESAMIERVLALAFGWVPAALMLSRAFTGRWWSLAEVVVALFGAALSLVLGPILFDGSDALLSIAIGPPWFEVRQREIVVDMFWAAGILLVLVPAEFIVWWSYSARRFHQAYSRIGALIRGYDSADRARAELVRREVANLHRLETAETRDAITATAAYAEAWLEHPSGRDEAVFEPLAEALDREMATLFGRTPERPNKSSSN